MYSFVQKKNFLKIEFFRKGYYYRQFAQREYNLPPNQLTISRAYQYNKNGKIIITPSMTVKELEKKCEEQFGIAVQVYRKFGNLWLETTMTNDWTMQQQNNHGGESSIY